jgi:hypothetical protein
MGVMAIIASRVGSRLVVDIGLGVDRPPVGLDLSYHLAQPREFRRLALTLSGFPEAPVAPNAADLSIDVRLVRKIDDVLVALHARALAMHALSEFLRRNMQLANLPLIVGRGEPRFSMTTQT